VTVIRYNGIWLPGRCRPLAHTELRAEQWLVLIRREIEDNLMDVFNPREAMTDPTITELEQRITMLRQNINELIEQAAAYELVDGPRLAHPVSVRVDRVQT
jgi:hypothetical protein